jgi:hypothetical protein
MGDLRKLGGIVGAYWKMSKRPVISSGIPKA